MVVRARPVAVRVAHAVALRGVADGAVGADGGFGIRLRLGVRFPLLLGLGDVRGEGEANWGGGKA